jgi:hypothetical protein
MDGAPLATSKRDDDARAAPSTAMTMGVAIWHSVAAMPVPEAAAMMAAVPPAVTHFRQGCQLADILGVRRHRTHRRCRHGSDKPGNPDGPECRREKLQCHDVYSF